MPITRLVDVLDKFSQKKIKVEETSINFDQDISDGG